MSATSARLATLMRYPIKGFSGDRLDAAMITGGEALPLDRAFAVEFRDSGFDEAAPQHVKKSYFLQLALFPELAPPKTRFDPQGRVLTIRKGDTEIVAAPVDTGEGRAAIAAALAGALKKPLPRPPRFVAAGAVTLTDQSRPFLSLINLASVAELGATLGQDLDPVRFRGNLYVEGWQAWAEAEMIGKRLKIGPSATFEVVKPIERCKATEIDLQTGEHDAPVLETLHTRYGHRNCGIFLAAVASGPITEGDAVTLLD